MVGNPGHKGGNRFQKVLNDLVNLYHQEPGSVVTTFFDYYGLPGDWPGRTEATDCRDLALKPLVIESGLCDAMQVRLGEAFDGRRFVPYVQMHELEALLFSNPEIMANVFGQPELQPRIEDIVRECGGCEAIDDSPLTAPSKRIAKLYPRYQKGSSVNAHAPAILDKTGIDAVRGQCPHFNDWIARLLAMT